MLRPRGASGALALLFLLTGACLPPPSAPGPAPPAPTVGSAEESPPGAPWRAAAAAPGPGVRWGGADAVEGNGEEQQEQEEEEEEEELFKDVDPKTLAAVLLEALNKPPTGRGAWEEGEEGEEVRLRAREEEEEEEDEGAIDDPKEPAVRAAESRERDREREQPELELVMAAAALQGREEERERQEAREEEERLTEKVTSRTVSQVVPVKPAPPPPPPPQPGAAGQEAKGQGPAPAAAPGDLEGESRNEEEEEEEQLNPEELKNLETMMKEFPSLGAASKRDDGEREGRGFNDVLPHKAAGPPLSRAKLRWQEETQKGLSFPSFRGGNFMDEFEEARPAPPPGAGVMEDAAEGEEEQEEEDGEDREELSPEEEEAQAKAEQEEVRRQAAEVQRAKVEEEKLADVASDMLLQYMVKQNGGKRKYRQQGRKYPSLPNAAEDKRSDEVDQDQEEDQDDIDPQTIDKLIEISSKLHLPADDVVDIISDVEKKKKKDLPPQTSPWLRPSSSSSSSLTSSSVKGMSASPDINQINYLSPKQSAAQALNPLKTWFSEDPGAKGSVAQQDPWRKPLKPRPSALDLFPQLQASLSSNKGGLIAKPQRTFWGGYPPDAAYPGYQRTPYRGYYPVYRLPSPPKPKPRYYLPNAYPYAFGSLRGGPPPRRDYDLPPRRHYHSWVQPRLRTPPASLQRSYYHNYLLPSYLQTFQRAPSPRSPPRSAGRLAALPRSRFYYQPAPAPAAAREPRPGGNQGDDGNYDDVDVQQLLAQRLRKFQ